MRKALVLFFLTNTTLFAQQQDSIAVRYSKIISAKTLSKHLHVLASDKYEGRETGKKGQKMAAKYIAEQFKDAGIPPYKNNTYYEEFTLNEIVPKPVVLSVDGKFFHANKDYFNYPGESKQKIESNSVLFLGYGIQDEKYNDYANADVKDKVVMVLSGEPITKDSLSLITGNENASIWSGYYKTKSRKAKELGAKALLMVVDDIKAEVSENKHRIEAVRLELENKKTEMPTIFISRQLANYILRNDLSISTIEETISNTQKPLKIDTKTNVLIEIKNNINKVTSENVLGFIEGSDLKEQLIVVTAHYDHLGMESKKGIYNGADDDGSGTVAIINMAAAFERAKKEGNGPRRSMLFMTVSGEEKGLLCSS